MKRAAPPPGRRGPVLLMLLVTCVATFAGIARVWTQIEAVDQGYRLARASRIHDRLLQENRALRIELQHLKRPDRVARIAARDLGLRPPEPGQVRRLRLSAVAPELASAPPRPAPPVPGEAQAAPLRGTAPPAPPRAPTAALGAALGVAAPAAGGQP